MQKHAKTYGIKRILIKPVRVLKPKDHAKKHAKTCKNM